LVHAVTMPTDAAVRARLEAFCSGGGRMRALVRQLGPGWSHVKLGRFRKGRPCLDQAKLTQLDAVLDDPDTSRKQDRRLDDPHRLAIARAVQNQRDPFWPYAPRRFDFATPIRTFHATTGDRDYAAAARDLVLPRARAGLVRDVDGAGTRACWFLGRLRLFRAHRVVHELANAARCCTDTAAPGAAT
jgi:hypothetical protein